MNFEHSTFISALATMIVSGAASVALYARVLTALRERHEGTWKSLGAPSLVLNNSPKSSLRFWKFNIRREYRRLGDPKISRLFWWMNTVSIVYGLSFAFLLSVFFTAVTRA